MVLVHQGGFQNQQPGLTGQPITSDINGCTGELRNADGSDSDLRAIVKKLDDAVDLVISAHTHAAYNCSASTVDVRGSSLANAVSTPRPTGIPNLAGRLVPVTSASAFGRVLTEIDVQISPVTRNIISVSANNVVVDQSNAAANVAIANDPTVRNIVAAYSTAAAPLSNQVIATLIADVANTSASSGEIPAGDLIADAQLQATQPMALGRAQIAFMNPGGIRSTGFVKPVAAAYPYNLTYGDAFTVQPFGNSLVTMTLTAQQIKDVLEQQFAGCLGQVTSGNRIMQISNGFSYTWSTGGTCGSRIKDVNFVARDLAAYPPLDTAAVDKLVIAGVVQNPTKTYRVTVNSFMATGGDNFTTFASGTGVLGGAQDIDALVSYLLGYKAPNSAYNPASAGLNKPRITTVP